MTPRSRLFLIDANNQMYRAYHAIRGLSGPDGKSTNAVYGFVTMLRKLLADHKPEYIAASFDLAGPTFRDQLATDYKANRTPMPDDLASAAHQPTLPLQAAEQFIRGAVRQDIWRRHQTACRRHHITYDGWVDGARRVPAR